MAKTWKQPTVWDSIDDWIKKMWYIYTMEYYSPTRKDEILPLAIFQMDLEKIKNHIMPLMLDIKLKQ